jgi:hypothetical protein
MSSGKSRTRGTYDVFSAIEAGVLIDKCGSSAAAIGW